MTKITVILSCLLFGSVVLNAQTQRIAHRSHSGSNKTFIITTNENWGLSPAQEKKMEIERIKLDSIKQKGIQADTARKVALKQIAKDKISKKVKTKKS